jgi:hypothetical protein
MNALESQSIIPQSQTGTKSCGGSDRSGKTFGSSSGKKKKKGSRRRKDNEIYKATDTSLNAQRQLNSVVFQNDSNIVKTAMPKGAARLVVAEGQFDNAPEMADLVQLRQYHSSNSGAMTHPPFGFFSLHPSTLSLHPLSAVHLFYPMAPLMINNSNSGNNHNNNTNNSIQNSLSQNTLNSLGLGSFRPGAFVTPTAAAVAAAASGFSASSSAISPFHNPRLINQQRLQQQPNVPSPNPGTTHHPSAQHHAGISGMPTQQQIQHAQAAVAAGQPSFMEYAAAVKRQQHLEFTLQQEAARSEEHLKALTDNQKAAMRQQMNGVLTPAAIIARQSQQVQAHAHAQATRPQQLQPREQLLLEQQQQQKQHAAAVIASLNQQQNAQSSRGQPVTSERAGPVSAMMALAVASESSNRAAAAAALLRQYASTEGRQKRQILAAMSGMSESLLQSQPRASAQQQPREVVADDPGVPSIASEQQLVQQQQLEPLQLKTAAMSSRGSSLQQDDGSTGGTKSKKLKTSMDSSPLTSGMDQLERLPMRAYTPPDEAKKYPVRESEITDCDVYVFVASS